MLLILLAASMALSQQASTDCMDTGAKTATAETHALRGPDGTAAVLKVSTADDHSKNSHLCNAEYQLLLLPAGASAGAPRVVELAISDSGWGRSLSLRLDGFSGDGKHVFGILSEGGTYPLSTLFDYDIAKGAVQLVDLREQFANILDKHCSTTFAVIGNTESGTIVVETDSARPCGPRGRWLLNPAGGRAQRLTPGASFESLSQLQVSAP
jgi:hypothetical protein